jgi:hypothetical protein
MQGRSFLLAEAFKPRSIIPELRPTFDGPQIKRELLRKGRPLALCVRTRTDRERLLRVELTSSPSRRRMASICAFETLGDVSCRRIADVADPGAGRLNWAESAPTALGSGRTGVRAIPVIPYRARNRVHPAKQTLRLASRPAPPIQRRSPQLLNSFVPEPAAISKNTQVAPHSVKRHNRL